MISDGRFESKVFSFETPHCWPADHRHLHICSIETMEREERCKGRRTKRTPLFKLTIHDHWVTSPCLQLLYNLSPTWMLKLEVVLRNFTSEFWSTDLICKAEKQNTVRANLWELMVGISAHLLDDDELNAPRRMQQSRRTENAGDTQLLRYKDSKESKELSKRNKLPSSLSVTDSTREMHDRRSRTLLIEQRQQRSRINKGARVPYYLSQRSMWPQLGRELVRFSSANRLQALHNRRE